MLDRPQMPSPPEGCVYGPWWDEIRSDWFADDGEDDGLLVYSEQESRWLHYASTAPRDRELLRLAKDNEAKTAFIRKTVDLYGKAGGPWNIPSDPGGWLHEARNLLGEATVSHEEAMKEIEK